MSKSPEILDDREFLRHCLARADMGVANLDAAVAKEFGIREVDPIQQQLEHIQHQATEVVPEISTGSVDALKTRANLLAQPSTGNPFHDQEAA